MEDNGVYVDPKMQSLHDCFIYFARRPTMMRPIPLRHLLIPAFLLLSPLLNHAQDDAVRKEVEVAERAGGHAAFIKDLTTVEKYWSPQMLVNSPGNSILTRDQVFAAIREDKLKYSNYTNEVEAFHAYGDVAVVMGHETLVPDTGPEAGTKLYRRYTDVWQRTNGAWMQIARQATYTDESKVHYDKSK
jgi:ketosteroid isomerase-like protein